MCFFFQRYVTFIVTEGLMTPVDWLEHCFCAWPAFGTKISCSRSPCVQDIDMIVNKR